MLRDDAEIEELVRVDIIEEAIARAPLVGEQCVVL